MVYSIKIEIMKFLSKYPLEYKEYNFSLRQYVTQINNSRSREFMHY